MTRRPNSKPRSDKKYFTDEERKAANREKAKRHYDKNPKRSNALWLKYSRSIKGRAQALRSGAQQRAKKKNQPMELDNEWLITRLEHGHCEVTGIGFVLDSPQDCAIHPFTPSIDKIVPALGYTKENCRMVVFAVNAAKQDWTDDTLLAVAAAIFSNRNILKDFEMTLTVPTIKDGSVTTSFQKPVFELVRGLIQTVGRAKLADLPAYLPEIGGAEIIRVLEANKRFLKAGEDEDAIIDLIVPAELREFWFETDPRKPQHPLMKPILGSGLIEPQAMGMAAALKIDYDSVRKEYHTHDKSKPNFLYLEVDAASLLSVGYAEQYLDVIGYHWNELTAQEKADQKLADGIAFCESFVSEEYKDLI